MGALTSALIDLRMLTEATLDFPEEELEKERKQRPILLFENVKGTKFPVLTNLHASRSRLALAMGAAPADMLTTYLRAMDKPIAPKIVASGRAAASRAKTRIGR